MIHKEDWREVQASTCQIPSGVKELLDSLPKVFCMTCFKWFKDEAAFQNHVAYCEKAEKDVCDYPDILSDPE